MRKLRLRLSHLPKIAQVMSYRTDIWLSSVWLKSLYVFIYSRPSFLSRFDSFLFGYKACIYLFIYFLPSFLLSFSFFHLHPSTFLHFTQRERKGERKKHQCEREISIGCLLISALTRDQTQNLSMFPDQEFNPWPFGLWDNTPTNRATPTNWATPPRAKACVYNNSAII